MAPPPLPEQAQRALTFGLLLSATRCIVQYVVLPFLLPWVGIVGTIPPWIMIVLGAVALGALARNVRAMWRVRHARRWNYIAIAGIVAASLLVFGAVDVRALIHG